MFYKLTLGDSNAGFDTATLHKVKTNTAAVTAFRARQHATGGTTLYSVIDADATAAIETIRWHNICTRREAVEMALKRFADQLNVKR